MDKEFGGQIQTIQWNNNLKSIGLCFYFIFGIFVYVTLVMLAAVPIIFGVIAAFDWQGLLADFQTFELETKHIFKILKPYIKVTLFIGASTLWFLHRDLKEPGKFFNATWIELPHNDPFYQTLENFCIMRGLTVPKLFSWTEGQLIPPQYHTGAVLRDLTGKTSLIVSQAIYYELDKKEQEAFLAQVVQRIHSKDVQFMSLFCFLGFFTYHIKQETPKFLRPVLTPFINATDWLMRPIRNKIISMRFSRTEIGALELTKEKQPITSLLNKLTPLETIQHHVHDPYLTLFITKTDKEYRQALLKQA